ncbi:MAG TPA: DUF2332 domain-containing protein [Propionibacteriaceae bacterium]|nr:DUF2332 domain-containing protein [Propionibacteriaceae bacterium]
MTWDQGASLADRFRAHAGTAQHLYGHAMRGMADDWEAGGPVRMLLAGYDRAPRGSALSLRLLAGVFRLVLTDRAPELVRFYPCLGGLDEPADAWPVMRAVLAEHPVELRAALEVPPQTNEIGRSAALLAGLFDVIAATGVREVRLLEVGASAGLNLLVDRFHFRGSGWSFGPVDSPVQLIDPIEGDVRSTPFSISQRRGCDRHPIDATNPAGRLLLTSFVWPFDLHRHERLAAALSVAVDYPVAVDRAGAADWLAHELTVGPERVLPVIWQSITQLYWAAEEVAAVESALAAFGAQHPVARVSLEFAPGDEPSARPELTTSVWRPGAAPRRRRLGAAHDHGLPVRLDRSS